MSRRSCSSRFAGCTSFAASPLVAREFHLGRNAPREYREREKEGETGYCSAFLTVGQMSSAKATSAEKGKPEDIDFNATVSVSVAECHGKQSHLPLAVSFHRRTRDRPSTAIHSTAKNGKKGSADGTAKEHTLSVIRN